MNHFSTPDALLRELSRRGVLLEIQGQKLKFQASKGSSAVTDLFPDLQRHKVALILTCYPSSSHFE
ncbi:hypothetical protein B1R32_1275 [Abditibacterium utsteinense]|uniref:TubC N-terminal docking domain-containing protein n=1 Tax=Abditibacterium utsteinense TaxID=1960156 RepID=A0A2S8SP71_9BACT|nr:hypothetical protein [Abditibacterium utsteinense]PQV62593.1 hypothetical protein B1R32_1275 [Abditibacterium utsteinense]